VKNSERSTRNRH